MPFELKIYLNINRELGMSAYKLVFDRIKQSH